MERLLTETFVSSGYTVFDVCLTAAPPDLKEDVLGDFWGGFKLEFKVIPRADFDRLGADQRRLRTNALSLGRNEQRAFRVDLSKHEYVEGKVARELDGYTVYMYSPLMIVCEKIRAICQQMPEYRRVVRSASARGRARDFFDIHYLVTTDGIRLDTEAAHRTLRGMFDVKRVPLWLIGRISEHRDFHRESFEALKDTVLANHALLDFDTYVEFVVAQLQPLQPLWEEQPPLG